MADLVERLRKLSDDCMEDGYEDQGIGLHDAANELDRLRAEVASLKDEQKLDQQHITNLTELHKEALETNARHMAEHRDLTQQLAAAPTIPQDAREWISVNDRLPDQDGWYLVFTKLNETDVLYFSNGKWQDFDDDYGSIEMAEQSIVTDWMLRPPPPLQSATQPDREANG